MIQAPSLELFENEDFGGGYGGTLFLDDYIPQKLPATSGELWLSFVNQPSKPPFKIGNVVAGQVVQIPLPADEPVRLYLISHDGLGNRITSGFANAKTFDFLPNKENLVPVITQNGAAGNSIINFIASNYSEKTRFRKIQFADDINFTQNLVENIQGSVNSQGVMTPNFSITRTGDLTNSKAVYVRIAQSSNNIEFGNFSTPLQVTFAAQSGSGGSGGGTLPPPEAPPSNLNLSEANGVVTLTWQNNSGSGDNVIERKINGDAWTELTPDLLPTATTFSETVPAIAGTNTFSYRVKNRNVTGYSAEVSATITVSSTPPISSAPTNFAYTTTDIDDIEVQIDLTWTSNSGNGNIVLERRLSLDQAWQELAVLPASQESYQDTVFRSQTSKTYRYRLSNSLVAEYREVSIWISKYVISRFEQYP